MRVFVGTYIAVLVVAAMVLLPLALVGPSTMPWVGLFGLAHVPATIAAAVRGWVVFEEEVGL